MYLSDAEAVPFPNGRNLDCLQQDHAVKTATFLPFLVPIFNTEKYYNFPLIF